MAATLLATLCLPEVELAPFLGLAELLSLTLALGLGRLKLRLQRPLRPGADAGLPYLPAGSPLFCVTLNPDAPVDDRYVWQRFVYEHPLFNPQSWSAQLRREEINGQQRSWYCGAYWYNGFHEDGVRSALDVVQGIAVAEGN